MSRPKILTPIDRFFYEDAASDYCKTLPLEHFMETTHQATQRKVTVASFDQITPHRPDIHCYSELLIQYPLGEFRNIGRVCPDNMIVLYDGTIKAEGSYNLPFQPVGPLMVIESVSKSSHGKDYEESFVKYEQQAKVPYYLMYHPVEEELLLFKLRPRKGYVSIKPNADGSYAIPELEVEVAEHEHWLRYWFRGKLLPLTAELAIDLEKSQKELRRARQQLRKAESRIERAEAQAAQATAQAEQERLARLQLEAELTRLRAAMGHPNGGASAS